MAQIFEFLAHCAKRLIGSEPAPQVVVNVNGRPSRAQWVREARDGRKAA